MKPYLSFFKMSLLRNLQYRIAALAGIATQFFFGFIFIMIFKGFYSYSSITPDISFKALVQTVWLQQSFLFFIMLWLRDNEIFHMITTGQIAYEMVRPTHMYFYWSAKLLGQRLAGGVLRFLPILFIACFLPEPYNLVLPDSFTTLILFLTTLVLGLILIITLTMIIYISVFYTLSPTGSFLLFRVLGEFLGGATIPIPLMPDTLKTITYLLPFRYSGDLPFRIYAGHIHHEEAVISIFVQIFWILLLGVSGNYWMKHALKKIVVQGG
ncbi:MAG: ABC transporter permease [Clostridia bacterium]|nr:ABC transporter permease [Clostridia bacterium]